MEEEVYIDVIFLMNFFMDYMLLRITGRCFAAEKRRIRYVLAATVGGLFSCGRYFLPESLQANGTTMILLHGVCGLLMLRIGPGFRKSGMLMKGVLCLYFTAFFFGGFLEMLKENGRHSPVTFLILTVVFYLALSGIGSTRECFRAQRRNLYTVTLLLEGKKCEICGFYDTGNFLCDPLSGKPVSVIESKALAPLISEADIEKLKYIMVNPGELENTDIFRLKPHLIPFRSVGAAEGVLVAITLDELCIHTPKELVRISKPMLALQYEPSTLGSEYQVLLNSRLLLRGETLL